MATVEMNAQEVRTYATFSTLMWTLSHPGRVQRLPWKGLAVFSAIGETLVDLETSFYTPNDELEVMLMRTGGRALAPDQAMYQFYPELEGTDQARLQEAPTGTYTYPDKSATLVLGAKFGTGEKLRLSGPGILETNELSVEDIPDTFWELREQAIKYPMGWDVFLVDGSQVVGLPRTTKVEVL
jgi:alpha-D-ribose 1-methylphosphonate 5-triphosphate synthase subunit PhnH